MAEVSKETEQKINQLQMYEQSMQSLLMQKQQFQSKLVEIDSALAELDKAKDAYKIVANIMVSSDKDELKKELSSKKESSELRIKTIEKQEQRIKEKAEKLQSEVMKSMEK